jgi:hypothetical protein
VALLASRTHVSSQTGELADTLEAVSQQRISAEVQEE